MATASASVSYHALLPSPSLIHSHHLSISSVRRRRCCLPNPNATALSRFRPVRTASASPLAAFETEDKEARSDDVQEWAGGIGSAAHGEEEEEELDRVEPAAGEGSEGAEDSSGWTQRQPRPCELFVCNLPRRYGVDELLELFGPYGTVLSVEVSRDAETGISRGCGFVTMRSFAEARTAINALDGFDLDGREMFVKLAAHIVSNRRNPTLTHTPPMKDHIFESPYKIYVGNLAWSVQPQHLREHFTHCGTVVSTRLLSDRKGGRNRVYGFLSFSSTEELQAALQLNNTKFQGRDIIVREAHVKSPDS